MENPRNSMRERSKAMKSKIRSRICGHNINSAQQPLILKGLFVVVQNQRQSAPTKSVSVQIYSGTEVDPSKFFFSFFAS